MSGTQRTKLAKNAFEGLDDLPRAHFGAILADPPWHFRARTALQMSNWTSRRDAEKHFPVLGTEDIAAMEVKALAAPTGCHLFLWSTGPCLPQALEVMKAWGFRYSGIAFTWTKLRKAFDPLQLRALPTADGDFHVGLGLTTRKNCEFVLLGRRGNCRRNSKKVRELILAPRREHSRKPDEVQERIEEYCDGPYLELFARRRRPNWIVWGNEVEKFSAADVEVNRGKPKIDWLHRDGAP